MRDGNYRFTVGGFDGTSPLADPLKNQTEPFPFADYNPDGSRRGPITDRTELNDRARSVLMEVRSEIAELSLPKKGLDVQIGDLLKEPPAPYSFADYAVHKKDVEDAKLGIPSDDPFFKKGPFLRAQYDSTGQRISEDSITASEDPKNKLTDKERKIFDYTQSQLRGRGYVARNSDLSTEHDASPEEVSNALGALHLEEKIARAIKISQQRHMFSPFDGPFSFTK